MGRHESVFYYPVVRPYPFRWFTPIVVVGGLILTGLFSALNYYSNGFQLQNQSTQNPQSIQSDFLGRLPTFLTQKIQPQCQPLEIPIEGTVFTNQTALKYKVEGVKQCDDGVTWNAASALRYYNDIIQGCSIESLVITLQSREQTPQQHAWSQWAPRANAFISCNISNVPDPIFRTTNPKSQAKVNFTTEYSYVQTDVTVPPSNGPSSQGLFTMTYQDPKERASIWWGASLLSLYWVQTSERMTAAMANLTKDQTPVDDGAIFFTRNPAISDITDLDFFNVDYRFFQNNGNGTTTTFSASDASNNFSPRNVAAFDSHQTYPNVWIPADSLAKSFYSTILTDLGQVGMPSNILADTSYMTYFTNNMSQIISDVSKSSSNAMPGPATQNFADFGADTGRLEVTPVNLQSQFICQEPTLRPGFDVFVSILVQDLVMLNAIWRLYTLIVHGFFMNQKRAGPEHNYCQGCIANYSKIADVIASPSGGDVETPNPAPTPMREASSGGGGGGGGLYQRRSVMSDKWQANTSYQPVSNDDYRTEYGRYSPPIFEAPLPPLPQNSHLPKNM